MDAGHGAVGDGAAGVRTDRDGAAGAGVPGVHAASGWSFAQNFWIDGTPYWTGIQLDEVAFPIMLAWRLWKLDGLGKFDIVSVCGAGGGVPGAVCADYAAGAVGGECGVFAVDAGGGDRGAGVRGGHCAGAQAPELASFLEEYADWIEAHLDEWTTTKDGVLHPDVQAPLHADSAAGAGEPFHNPQIPPGCCILRIGSRASSTTFEAREIIDAGFLELVRYGIRRADDPLIVDSLKVVDYVLKIETPYGPCWRRYNHDGYGQRKDGGPYKGWGQGRAWPLLSGERGAL